MQVLRFGLVCLVAKLMGTSLGRAGNLECSCLCWNGVDALCIIDRGDQQLGSVLETSTNYGLVAQGKTSSFFRSAPTLTMYSALQRTRTRFAEVQLAG